MCRHAAPLKAIKVSASLSAHVHIISHISRPNPDEDIVVIDGRVTQLLKAIGFDYTALVVVKSPSV